MAKEVGVQLSIELSDESLRLSEFLHPLLVLSDATCVLVEHRRVLDVLEVKFRELL